jgi:hypothetical protein
MSVQPVSVQQIVIKPVREFYAPFKFTWEKLLIGVTPTVGPVLGFWKMYKISCQGIDFTSLGEIKDIQRIIDTNLVIWGIWSFSMGFLKESLAMQMLGMTYVSLAIKRNRGVRGLGSLIFGLNNRPSALSI